MASIVMHLYACDILYEAGMTPISPSYIFLLLLNEVVTMAMFRRWGIRGLALLVLSLLFSLWAIITLFQGVTHADASFFGLPLGLLIPMFWFSLLTLALVAYYLLRARMISLGARILWFTAVVFYVISSVGQLVNTATLMHAKQNSLPVPSLSGTPSLLSMIALIIFSVGLLVFSYHTNPNRSSWIRTIGAACFGAVLLFFIVWGWFAFQM
jgi:hypothetical protein